MCYLHRAINMPKGNGNGQSNRKGNNKANR